MVTEDKMQTLIQNLTKSLTPKKSQKIIINHENNLNKIQSMLNSNKPELLVLESEKESHNIKTNSIAYKLIMDGKWRSIETKNIKRKRDGANLLLKVTLIKSLVSTV